MLSVLPLNIRHELQLQFYNSINPNTHTYPKHTTRKHEMNSDMRTVGECEYVCGVYTNSMYRINNGKLLGT